MDRVEWCACKFGVLDQSIQDSVPLDSVALAEQQLTSTRKMPSASEMGTFSEPKLRDPIVVRDLVVSA